VARQFALDLTEGSSAYVVWDGSSGPCRTAREFQEAWIRAINRVW